MNITLTIMPPITNSKDTITLEVHTYEDVVSFIKNQYTHIISKIKNIFIIDSGKIITSDMLKFKVRGDITIGPMISGGVGFDSLGNLNVFYGTSSTISNQAVALTGLAKRVTESSLFGQGQTAFDIAQRRTNRANGSLENIEDPTTGFGSIASTSGFGLPVALHFGMVRTSGAVINTYVKHIQRGGLDNIRVVDYL
jgi:hypothetical protein